MKKQLPPDPDNYNDERAEWAAAALRHFQCTTGTDYEDVLGDLLCDLMHWCDRNNFDFELALQRARGHYEAEAASETAKAKVTETDAWLIEYAPYVSPDHVEIPCYRILDGNGTTLADTTEDLPGPEQEKIAKLMGAAPRLLRALDYFFNIMHDYKGSMQKGYVKLALDQARDALAAARP